MMAFSFFASEVIFRPREETDYPATLIINLFVSFKPLPPCLSATHQHLQDLGVSITQAGAINSQLRTRAPRRKHSNHNNPSNKQCRSTSAATGL
jgi:hypothetical protein